MPRTHVIPTLSASEEEGPPAAAARLSMFAAAKVLNLDIAKLQ